MKVILLEDVKSLGKKGQLVDVSDGYARNFILSKKKGIEATAKNMNDLKLQKAHEDKLAAQRLEEAKLFAAEIAGRGCSGTESRRRRKTFRCCFFERDCAGGERAAEHGAGQEKTGTPESD